MLKPQLDQSQNLYLDGDEGNKGKDANCRVVGNSLGLNNAMLWHQVFAVKGAFAPIGGTWREY